MKHRHQRSLKLETFTIFVFTCPQQQSKLKNQNKVIDQDIGTGKYPLLHSGSILTTLLEGADYKGGNIGIINHVYQEKQEKLMIL